MVGPPASPLLGDEHGKYRVLVVGNSGMCQFPLAFSCSRTGKTGVGKVPTPVFILSERNS